MNFRAATTTFLTSTVLTVSSLFAATAPALQPQSAPQETVALQPRVPAQKQTTAISPSALVSHIIVKFKDDSQVRLAGNAFTSSTSRSVKSAETVLQPYLNGERVTRLIANFDEKKLDKDRDLLQYRSRHQLADLNNYYRIAVGSAAEAQQVIDQLNQLDEVETAYYQPAPEPAGFFDFETADYTSFQDYREAAPSGVDADYANLQPGGTGSGVMIVDIEGAWRDTHEDLGAALGGLLGGTMINDASWRNHGTAVLGEMVSSNNGFGVTGISYGADVGMVSISTLSLTEAFYIALDTLKPGDVILIELHAPGPHYNFQDRPDQLGYVCMEYWQDNFDVIQYAWAKGVVVVEAAGNGAENFGDAGFYGQLFDTTYRNSHAIIAGAGYPAASANNLQRQSFSNYGARVNLQGYGSGVYSTGYGDLTGTNEDNRYTAGFSGTSSASPIITGSVASLQGHYKATYGVPMTSDQIRKLLNATGTPQLGNVAQHIGPRPNLFAAFAAMPAPVAVYATPILVDTSVTQGTIANKTVWLHNRSNSLSFDYSIAGNDSLMLSAADWLQVSPTSGTIPPNDSDAITVTLDATVISGSGTPYKGVLDVSWGISGGPLDSTTFVPAYVRIPCADSSYSVLSSNDVGGPTFHWISAKTLGFKIQNSNLYTLGSDPKDDGTTGPWPVRFKFPLFDSFVDSLYLGVNGGLSFTDTIVDPSGFFSGVSLPGSPLSSFITAFWNDLIFNDVSVPDASFYIYWNSKKDTTVIEWYRPSNFNTASDTLTNFEIILTKDGNIVCQYQNVGNSGLANTCVVGVSKVDCQAASYFDNNDIPAHKPANNMAIRFKNLLGTYEIAGNTNGVGGVTVQDLVYLVSYLFTGGPAPLYAQRGDLNCSGNTTIQDLTYMVSYLFSGGPAPCGFFRYY